MQGYSKGSKGPFITVDYDSYVETSMQGYIVKGVMVPS
jgi:hypothetical protein